MDIPLTRRRLNHVAGKRTTALDLLTIRIPGPDAGPCAFLHLLLPVECESSSGPALGSRRFDHLSRREKEVLCLLAAGRSTVGVADELFISPVTVRNHVQRILGKLGVHGRLDAILAYLRPAVVRTRGDRAQD